VAGKNVPTKKEIREMRAFEEWVRHEVYYIEQTESRDWLPSHFSLRRVGYFYDRTAKKAVEGNNLVVDKDILKTLEKAVQRPGARVFKAASVLVRKMSNSHTADICELIASIEKLHKKEAEVKRGKEHCQQLFDMYKGLVQPGNKTLAGGG